MAMKPYSSERSTYCHTVIVSYTVMAALLKERRKERKKERKKGKIPKSLLLHYLRKALMTVDTRV